MRLAVVGSRKVSDYDIVSEAIEENYPNVSFIVSGGAIGTDSLSVLYAQIHNHPYKEHLPDPNNPSYADACKARNTLIIDDCEAVLAIWDGKSPGTRDSIQKARDRNLPLIIVKI